MIEIRLIKQPIWSSCQMGCFRLKLFIGRSISNLTRADYSRYAIRYIKEGVKQIKRIGGENVYYFHFEKKGCYDLYVSSLEELSILFDKLYANSNLKCKGSMKSLLP